MNRFLLVGAALVAATAAAAAGLVHAQQLTFPLFDSIEPATIALALCAGALIYQRRKVPQFVLGLVSLAMITTFSACYSVLMYAEASLNRPLQDLWLQGVDAGLGIHVPGIVSWTAAHPAVSTGLRWCYASLIWQTPAVIALLSFTCAARELRGLVVQFVLAALVCAAVFALFPAAGPFASYGYAPQADQSRYIDHFQSLRSGARTVASWRGAEGLITFPSFHTTWALLLVWSMRRRKFLCAPALALNLGVVLSTLTTGWHYGADVLGGVLAAVIAILIEQGIWRWCERPAPAAEKTATGEAHRPRGWLDVRPADAAL